MVTYNRCGKSRFRLIASTDSGFTMLHQEIDRDQEIAMNAQRATSCEVHIKTPSISANNRISEGKNFTKCKENEILRDLQMV